VDLPTGQIVLDGGIEAWLEWKGASIVSIIFKRRDYSVFWKGLFSWFLVLAFSLMPVAQAVVTAAESAVRPYPHAPISFTELVDRVAHVVVNISSTKIIRRESMLLPRCALN